MGGNLASEESFGRSLVEKAYLDLPDRAVIRDSLGYVNLKYPSTVRIECHESLGWIIPMVECLPRDIRRRNPMLLELGLDAIASTLAYESSTHKADQFRQAFHRFLTGTVEARENQIFTCYPIEDRPQVEKYVERMLRSDLNVWYDEKNLYLGQDWQNEVRKAIENSAIFIVFIGAGSFREPQQFEIDCALEIAELGSLKVVPVLLPGFNGPLPLRLDKLTRLDNSTSTPTDQSFLLDFICKIQRLILACQRSN